ncbi:MotA/TolQ/ExbB proton channel family protein [Limnobacter litoralis]|uniref:MotA/TolQ/ExbB proton channel domain-containing protein n=1 Tax=Limnobacter litoralis TaxID=481366 RepID=A0ABQ5YU77_9BURK|nr:MotA/TolQ/ExbB proton channel family protein [Limnobacter litoralis]GLR27597.1 hypothetical protein GCM10007875_26880 [Limnobacter litoralis]
MNPHKYTIFLYWLLIASATALAAAIVWDQGLLLKIFILDNTRICAFIAFCFVGGTLLAGWRSLYLSRQAEYLDEIQRNPRRVQFEPGQSICWDYLSHHDPMAKASEGQLLAEVMAEEARGNHQIGWFLAGLMIKLGLLGTVVGFVMMLATLQGISTLDVKDIQGVMAQTTGGMGVAMYTTLVGLVGSILLGLQYILLDRFADGLVARAVRFAHVFNQAKG